MADDSMLDPAEEEAFAELPGIPVDLAATSAVGFVVGGLTAAAVYACYPPVHGRAPLIATGVGSVLLIGALYVAVARLARLRAADWLVVGYALALVGVTAFFMVVEGVQVLRDHVPSPLGVPVAGVAPRGAAALTLPPPPAPG